MKTISRQQPTNQSGGAKGFFSKHLYTIVATSSVLVLGAVIALSVLFANRNRGGDEQIVSPPAPPAITFVLPLDSISVAQQASLTKLVYNPTLKEWRTVNGTVFATTDGATVKAISDGTVTSVQDTLLQGSVVTVEHADGLVSKYLSLKEDPTVTVGQTVKAGDTLGQASSRNKQYSHLNEQLYLELRQAGKLVDPMSVLPQAV